MYHVELRKFPHSFWRFNLSEQELFGSLLAGWVAGLPVEAGERRWNPAEATLTVLEGPRLAMQDLAMGRGWRNASRQGQDVTARALADARRQLASTPAGGGSAQTDAEAARVGADAWDDRTTAGEHLRERLATLLGNDAETLLGLWEAARERQPGRTPSECLALAEDAMRALDER